MIVFCSYYTHLKSIILAKIRNIAKTTERAQRGQSEADILAPPYGMGGRASMSASLLYGVTSTPSGARVLLGRPRSGAEAR